MSQNNPRYKNGDILRCTCDNYSIRIVKINYIESLYYNLDVLEGIKYNNTDLLLAIAFIDENYELDLSFKLNYLIERIII
jgi:hypothetical protein